MDIVLYFYLLKSVRPEPSVVRLSFALPAISQVMLAAVKNMSTPVFDGSNFST
jgi:hypothetical protein